MEKRIEQKNSEMSRKDYDLVHFCLRHMTSKEHIHIIFNQAGIKYKQSDSYEKLVLRLKESNNDSIDLNKIRNYFRNVWEPAPKELHIENLKKGILKGHSWHGAMPSMLHLSMQNKVRDHIDGKLNIEELISIGADIMKHEYFMVCVHDLCETSIIQNCQDTIPPIGSKSISDFVLNGIPYDLKITNYFQNHTKQTVNSNKSEVVKQLLAGADVLRLREQAKKTINNWGLNRFYVLVENQERWFRDPEGVLEELVDETRKNREPLKIEIEGITILTQLIAI
jgi:hypothetical protein